MTKREMRTIDQNFQAREDDEEMKIEGYFSVFNQNYDMGYGMSEEIDPHAFDKTLGGDIRALIDHNTNLVLGRTKAGTLTLRVDAHGLWGSISINPKDQDARNIYERVKRGDVNQCSFGFEIVEEETEFRDNGDIHWKVKEVNLFEVSVCTFPAYETTEVSARKEDAKTIQKRKTEAWKQQLADAHKWLKERGEQNA